MGDDQAGVDREERRRRLAPKVSTFEGGDAFATVTVGNSGDVLYDPTAAGFRDGGWPAVFTAAMAAEPSCGARLTLTRTPGPATDAALRAGYKGVIMILGCLAPKGHDGKHRHPTRVTGTDTGDHGPFEWDTAREVRPGWSMFVGPDPSIRTDRKLASWRIDDFPISGDGEGTGL